MSTTTETTTTHLSQNLPAMPSVRVRFPDGHKPWASGAWGYAHVEADDLWEAIEVLRAYAAKIDVITDGHKPAGPRFRRLAATLRITARLADAAAASVDNTDERALCRAYLADLDRASAERAKRDAEQAKRDAEQAKRDAEQERSTQTPAPAPEDAR